MRPNLKEKRQHKIFSDYGINDYYAFYKKNGGILDKKTFKKCIYTFNGYLHKLICNLNYEYILPKRLGAISVVQVETYIKINEEGKLVTNRPVNHKATLDMWEKYPEAKEKKLLVRHENPFVFSLRYGRSRACFKNKSLYSLSFTREFQHCLRDTVMNNPNYRAPYKYRKIYGK